MNQKWDKHISEKEMGDTQNIHIIKQTQEKKLQMGETFIRKRNGRNTKYSYNQTNTRKKKLCHLIQIRRNKEHSAKRDELHAKLIRMLQKYT